MDKKQVKIIGLSIVEQFGSIKATELKFDANLKLTVVKGEVGAGKTTLNKALRLTTQGSDTLIDKNLYDGKINMVAQLLDGDKKVFVGCKSEEGKPLTYFLYELDENGKKVKDPIIDGVKATPASYLKSLQTSLTWRLNELTSENPTTQRNLLLDIYSSELEKRGVVFDKKSPKYVGGIIDQIEKAKEERSFCDMKRKEVGGIADDLNKKGIDSSERKIKLDLNVLNSEIIKLQTKRQSAIDNPLQEKNKSLLELKNKGLELSNQLRKINDDIKISNKPINEFNDAIDKRRAKEVESLNIIKKEVLFLLNDENLAQSYIDTIKSQIPELAYKQLNKELEFNEKGSCTSKVDDFNDNDLVSSKIKEYINIAVEYSKIMKLEVEEVDLSDYDIKINDLQEKLKSAINFNKDCDAVNSLIDWRESNAKVNDLNRNFFSLLQGIDTGVSGLHIAPEYDVDKEGNKIARGNDIYLMYDGSYDSKYFNNPDKELRKLSAYSDTQKPMICLLIQNYLLSKKDKVLPYLWIDQVPIDKKTKALLDKMSEDLGLWLFVNWTGDFDKSTLQDGEILIENGEIFQN